MSSLNIDIDRYSPYVDVAKGVFFGAVFLIAAGFTLETTQALFMHQNANNLAIQWDIFMQIPDALQGKYTGSFLDAILWSWVLLSCYIIASSLKRWVNNGIAEEGLEIFCHIMIGLDGFANYEFLSGHEWYYQIGFTIMVCLVLMHFGRVSVNFIKAGIAGL